jgi:ribonuclease Z
VFITHSHIDHVACLPLTMIGDVRSGHVFNLYGPEKAQSYIDKYIKSMFEVNAMANIETIDCYKYNGLNPGDIFRLAANNTDLEIEVFKCDHVIPTISYGISELKKKLKPEYLDLPGKEIARLRKNGVDITSIVKHKRLAYVCDTSIAVFDLNPDILNYTVIFIECTFFLPDEVGNATETKHIHWYDLKPYVIKNQDKFFVLFHFSQRYIDIQISEFFQKELDSGIKNIYWW